MKQIINLLLLLFLSITSYSQSYNITYLQKNDNSALKINAANIPPHLKAHYKKMIEDTEKLSTYYNLKYVNGQSKFSFFKVENVSNNFSASYTTTYKDFSKKEIYTTGGLMQDDEAVKRYIKKDFKWIYENETKDILGYTCKKAYFSKNGQKTTVWYTTKIPIMDGPSIYAGVRGLILKVETAGSTYTASKIEKIATTSEKVTIPKFKTFISSSDYKKSISSKTANRE